MHRSSRAVDAGAMKDAHVGDVTARAAAAEAAQASL